MPPPLAVVVDYGQALLAQARGLKLKEEVVEYKPAVRDAGFRYAVVYAYEHRCALCGIRVLSSDGHTIVEAAHIIPWSLSHDDRPTNGIALCRLCHWVFDKGLLGISENYHVVVSPQLMASNNLPGHLATLKARAIIGPTETIFWPDLEALAWHRHEYGLRG